MSRALGTASVMNRGSARQTLRPYDDDNLGRHMTDHVYHAGVFKICDCEHPHAFPAHLPFSYPHAFPVLKVALPLNSMNTHSLSSTLSLHSEFAAVSVPSSDLCTRS